MSDLATEEEKTIHTTGSDMTFEERSAIKTGEKRGERVAMAENPERFGMARARARNKTRYDKNYPNIDWSKT